MLEDASGSDRSKIEELLQLHLNTWKYGQLKPDSQRLAMQSKTVCSISDDQVY